MRAVMNEIPTMNYRQKTLVRLLGVLGGRLPRLDLQKYLFLYTQEFQKEPDFEFVPYKFGCFSFQSYADRRRLIELAALSDTEEWQLQKHIEIEKRTLFNDDQFDVFYERYSRLKGNDLVQHVYRHYPYYAINSEIASDLMTAAELKIIRAAKPDDNDFRFFTIGYEGSSFEGYLNRLIKNNVRTLVDVRRNPLSRKYGFSKKTLSDTVQKMGIEYIHLPELGIASDRRQNLSTQADYDRLFDAYEKSDLKKNKAALQQLFNVFLDHRRVAITCFEAHVCMCHRGRIANALSSIPEWKYDIQHI
jgi:uncharacterized protein (DUF488 family)